MTDDSITLDDLLAQQEEPDRPRVTIEAVPGDDTRVKVTPFVEGVGCLCSRALTVAKESIERLEPTGEHHVCCGHRLLVVYVTFSEPTLTDVFQQVTASIQAPAEHHEAGGPRAQPPFADMLAAASPYARPPWTPTGPPWQGPWGTIAPEKNFPNSTGNFGWDSIRCNAKYALCTLTCGVGGGSNLPADYVDRCLCRCDNELARCFDPAAPQRPCV